MTTELSIILYTGGGLLTFFSAYWFNKIDNKIDSFIQESSDNRNRVTEVVKDIEAMKASNEATKVEIEKQILGIAKDLRIMLQSQHRLTETVAKHDLRLENLEEHFKSRK